MEALPQYETISTVNSAVAGHGEDSRRPALLALQACNECRRRKGKCDRVVPECGTCYKYGRHCLYDQHSKSPLTRKHLTDVEHRLEAATAELHVLRRRLHALQHNHASLVSAEVEPVDSNTTNALESSALSLPKASTETSIDRSGRPFSPEQAPELYGQLFTWESIECNVDESSNIRFEGPPTTSDDFDWDEQDISMDSEWLEVDRQSEETSFTDGMASLSIDEHDTGYLGVASGAALLRLLQLDANGNSCKTPTQTQSKHECQRPRNKSATLLSQPDPNVHIIDAMIDSYFKTYHISYPIVHEPRFRAQLTEVIPRPQGKWKALMYMIAAVGAFSAMTGPGTADVTLFNAARAQLSMDDLESGNITLVQTLTLISNYVQKRNKPNSGYNYLGLALRMAMGIGLHKEFPNWNISPLQMEIRRRVWWTLFVFDIGATITFSRPIGWPHEGIEVALPLNLHDRNLTAAVTTCPPQAEEITTYSAVRAQVTFHLATNPIYTRVITVPFPTSQEVLSLDQQHLVPWLESLPAWYSESAVVPSKYSFGHAVIMWRYHNLRLIMYRPFLIRLQLKARQISNEADTKDHEACHLCMDEATKSIEMISSFWNSQPHTKLASWYTLYFIFQASLVPVFCLRNNPLASSAPAWRQDINLALGVIESMFAINPSSMKCYNTIQSLCGEYFSAALASDFPQIEPTEESPHTQISNIYPMMWPNVQLAEADIAMQDDAWREFLGDIPQADQHVNDALPDSWTFF